MRLKSVVSRRQITIDITQSYDWVRKRFRLSASSIFRTRPANTVALSLKWFQNVNTVTADLVSWLPSLALHVEIGRQRELTLGRDRYYEHGTLATHLAQRCGRGVGRDGIGCIRIWRHRGRSRRSDPGLQTGRHHRNPQHLPVLLRRLRRDPVFQGRPGERREGRDHSYRG